MVAVVDGFWEPFHIGDSFFSLGQARSKLRSHCGGSNGLGPTADVRCDTQPTFWSRELPLYTQFSPDEKQNTETLHYTSARCEACETLIHPLERKRETAASHKLHTDHTSRPALRGGGSEEGPQTRQKCKYDKNTGTHADMCTYTARTHTHTPASV